MSTEWSEFLVARIAELERRCQRKNHTIYLLRQNRDLWKHRARRDDWRSTAKETGA